MSSTDTKTAITVGELKEKLKNYDDNLIVMVMRDANCDLYPITAEDWGEYKAGQVYFPNDTVTNENEPGLRISLI
jgi:hypothetical protein